MQCFRYFVHNDFFEARAKSEHSEPAEVSSASVDADVPSAECRNSPEGHDAPVASFLLLGELPLEVLRADGSAWLGGAEESFRPGESVTVSIAGLPLGGAGFQTAWIFDASSGGFLGGTADHRTGCDGRRWQSLVILCAVLSTPPP